MNWLARIFRTWDYLLYFAVILLVILGIILIYSISLESEKSFALQQGIFACIGLVAMIILSFVDYRALGTASITLYVIGIIFLILLLIPGVGTEIAGSTRWINLGFFQFQPSELFKLILIIILAKYYSARMGDIDFRHIVYGFLITLLPMILILAEPDFGSAIVLFIIFITILIASGIRRVYLFIMGVILLIFTPITWLLLKDYQKERILSFLDPGANPFGSGYNILQSMIATGSGRFWGRGLGYGPQSQLNFLPVQQSDFIFGVACEQLGFVGGIVILGFFGVIISRMISLANIAKDNFGTLLAVGIAGMFIFQVLINAGMNIGIMPITGITLPLVSYGGSSLIVSMALIGILQSIHTRHKKISFE
ncbi:rod shape-determining protein RodA [Patescibacteria group bacterium]